MSTLYVERCAAHIHHASFFSGRKKTSSAGLLPRFIICASLIRARHATPIDLEGVITSGIGRAIMRPRCSQ